MATRKIKASNVRIGDFIFPEFGVTRPGRVESIIHLSPTVVELCLEGGRHLTLSLGGNGFTEDFVAVSR